MCNLIESCENKVKNITTKKDKNERANLRSGRKRKAKKKGEGEEADEINGMGGIGKKMITFVTSLPDSQKLLVQTYSFPITPSNRLHPDLPLPTYSSLCLSLSRSNYRYRYVKTV